MRINIFLKILKEIKIEVRENKNEGGNYISGIKIRSLTAEKLSFKN